MNTNRQPEKSDQPNRRILVVDDNPAIHKDFKKILCGEEDDTLLQAEAELFGAAAPAAPKAHGYELTSAHQGKEGLEAVCSALEKGTPFAMAFVDVRMPPGWDGM